MNKQSNYNQNRLTNIFNYHHNRQNTLPSYKYKQNKQNISPKFRSSLSNRKQIFYKTLSNTFYKKRISQQRFKSLCSLQIDHFKMQKKKVLSFNQQNNFSIQSKNKPFFNINTIQSKFKKTNKFKNNLTYHNQEQQKDFQKQFFQAKNKHNSIRLNFTSKKLPNFCYDSIFPITRYASVLTSINNRIFLHGGYSNNGTSDQLLFHEYNLQNNCWKTMENNGAAPWICPSFHTAQIYKNYILFIGGLSIDCKKGIRYYNTEINAYNIDKSQWIKIRWDHRIRSHASTIYGNNLIINGGVTQKQKISNKTFHVSLNSNNISNSVTFQTQDQSSQLFGTGIAYHKMINTYDFPGMIKAQLKIDGIIRFGGINSEGKMNNQIKLRKALIPGTMEYTHSSKSWQTLILKGQKPCPRVNHSMNIISKKGLCVVIGGQNQQGQALSDIWILNLFLGFWRQVRVFPMPLTFLKGISCHSSIVLNNKIFIFGGSLRMDNQNYEKFLYIDSGQIKQSGISKLQKKMLIRKESLLNERIKNKE